VLGEKVDLKEGTIVKTDKYKLKVLSCGGKGNTGAVYKVCFGCFCFPGKYTQTKY